MATHPKGNVLIFPMYAQKGSFERKKNKIKCDRLSSLVFIISFPRKNFIRWFFLRTSFLCHEPLFLIFFSSTRTHMLPLITKPVGPCQWIMLGTSNSMVTMAFFPCCEPKWFQVELNNKSQILHVHGPWCKQPMSSVWLVKVSKLTSHYPVVHQCTMGYGIP